MDQYGRELKGITRKEEKGNETQAYNEELRLSIGFKIDFNATRTETQACFKSYC